MRLGEVSAGGQRSRAREQELDPLVGGRVVGEKSKRDREPVCCARRRSMGAAFPASRNVATAACVALLSGALDVVCALRRADTAGRERVGAPLVSAEPPPAGRRLVDRAPHERMPEAKAAGHVGLANQVEAQQLVHGIECRRLVDRRCSRRELRVERIAGDGCAPEQRGARRREGARARRRARPRRAAVPADLPASRPACAPCDMDRALGRPGELLEIEGVAAAVLVQGGRGRLVDGRAEELSRLDARQSAELEADESAGAARRLECGGQPLRRLPRSQRDDEEDSCVRWPAKQRAEQVDRCGVGPVDVVEHEHERPASPSDARGARARRDGCGSARAGTPPRVSSRTPRATGRRSRDRCGRRRRARRGDRGSRPWRYSSSASTNTPNGRSRSSSDADPERTRWPRASARSASSERSRVLPMPGSPTSSTASEPPPSSSAARRWSSDAELLGAPDEVLGNRPFRSVRHEHRSGPAKSRNQGVPPMSAAPSRASGSLMPLLRAPPPSRAARVRCRVRLVQGAREHASPQGDARLVPLGRARDLVDGRGRLRSRGARAAARSTSPSAPPQRASARSRSHDRRSHSLRYEPAGRATGESSRAAKETASTSRFSGAGRPTA